MAIWRRWLNGEHPILKPYVIHVIAGWGDEDARNKKRQSSMGNPQQPNVSGHEGGLASSLESPGSQCRLAVVL